MAIIGHVRGNNAPLAQMAIEHFERDDVVVHRSNGGSHSAVDGRYYAQDREPLPIKCVVQPISSLKDRELIRDESGEHIEGHIVVWYQGELYATDDNNHEGTSDAIEYKGELFRVIAVQRRTEGAYFVRAICALWEDLEGEQHATSGNVV